MEEVKSEVKVKKQYSVMFSPKQKAEYDELARIGVTSLKFYEFVKDAYSREVSRLSSQVK